jgi:hypothetical protein
VLKNNNKFHNTEIQQVSLQVTGLEVGCCGYSQELACCHDGVSSFVDLEGKGWVADQVDEAHTAPGGGGVLVLQVNMGDAAQSGIQGHYMQAQCLSQVGNTST